MGMTPTGAGVANDMDVTRRRDDTKSASPFSGSQSQHLIPQSDRRDSNASSVGVKRSREEVDGAPKNGTATNGTGEHGQETKRTRVEPNGDSQPAATMPNGTPAGPVQAEEAVRVAHANEESEKQVEATALETKPDAAEGSEEGEVEE